MASRDIVNNVAVVQLLASANGAASPLTSLKSKILDTAGFESAAIVAEVGTLTGVDGSNYLTFAMQESNLTTDTSFTNVAITANLLGAVASSTADFGDQERPFNEPAGTSLGNLLANPPVIPDLYTGLKPLNVSTQANSIFKVGYLGSKRYIRMTATWTGSPTTVNLGLLGLLGHAQSEPVTAPAPITAT